MSFYYIEDENILQLNERMMWFSPRGVTMKIVRVVEQTDICNPDQIHRPVFYLNSGHCEV
jgi:hypothetical protein